MKITLKLQSIKTTIKIMLFWFADVQVGKIQCKTRLKLGQASDQALRTYNAAGLPACSLRLQRPSRRSKIQIECGGGKAERSDVGAGCEKTKDERRVNQEGGQESESRERGRERMPPLGPLQPPTMMKVITAFTLGCNAIVIAMRRPPAVAGIAID